MGSGAGTPKPGWNWSKLTRPGLLGGVLIAAGLILAVASLLLLQDAAREIERERAVSIRLERVLSSLKDIETGVRGYLITGQDPYLDNYRAATSRIGEEVNRLDGLGVDLPTLRAAVDDRIAAAKASLAEIQQSGREAVLARAGLGRGKQAMDRVRALVATAQAEADGREAAVERREAAVYWPMGVAAFLMLLGAVGMLAKLARQRRLAEQASAALLQDLLDNAPMGVGVLDQRLNVKRMNPALATISTAAEGRGAESVTLWDVLPEQRDQLEPKIDRVLSTGRPTSVDFVLDGEASERSRSYQATLFRFRSIQADGTSSGLGLLLADLTARKRAERRMQDSELRLRTLIENSANIIWIAAPDGRFERRQPRWNAFTGQSDEEVIGAGWLAAVHPDDRSTTVASWTHAVETKTPYAIEHRLHRADGEWRYMAVVAVPVFDEDGSVREWVGSHTDITERKLAEAELSDARDAAEASDRAKSTFLANMSHELRTPLSAVIGYSEMLEEEIAELGETTLLNDVVKIQANARHLLGLINDVLDLSKIEANKMDTYVETVPVATVVSDVAATVDALVKQKGNRLELSPADDLGEMSTDVVKLRQCLLNLLSNAAKFTENGQITLSVTRSSRGPEATVTFEVRDTGIGMTPEQLGRLFQRFVQADQTTTRRFGGTGLGLAITRAFSRLLGGDVSVASEPDHGTVFTLTVPATLPDRAAHAVDASPAEAARSAAALPDNPNVVLVVDDDANQRDLIARFLERQGFVARTASDGVTGLALARELTPRAIFLDVMMPQMDGWHVLNALKGDPTLGRIPVVMVTFTSDMGLSRTLGAAEHIAKPVDWAKLQGVLERLRNASGDILVVDDDADTRSRLRSVLERHGWTVQEAGNGQEAVAKVTHGPPRAILLDLTMPVMDGFAFLQVLRGMPGHKDIPVVVFSARDISASERLELADANAVLSKTAGLRELTGQIEKFAALPAGTAAGASVPDAAEHSAQEGR